MLYAPVFVFGLVFTTLAWRNRLLAFAVLFFLLPTYLIRFSIGSIPTTLLEIMVLIVLAVAIIKKEVRGKIQRNLTSYISKNKLLYAGIALFFLGGTISIFTAVDLRAALGEWKAFYIEPILLFFVLAGLDIKKYNAHLVLFALILSGLATSLLAVYQHFTGWMVPTAFWETGNSFRVTAWYGFPNGVGLFLAPLIPLAIFLIKQRVEYLKKKVWKLKTQDWAFLVSCFLFLVSAPLAILFAKSTGALVGLAAGIGFLLLWNKKTRWPALLLAIVCLVGLFRFPDLSGLKDEVFFQDRSGHIRLSIWTETWEFLKDEPILGAGLASYDERIEPYHTTVNGEGIEIFHHPHNIFLTMWVNLGILGLVGFVLILLWFFRRCFSGQQTADSIFLASSMIIVLVMGLVDSPYIKNDLAIFFWLLPALLFRKKPTNNKKIR